MIVYDIAENVPRFHPPCPPPPSPYHPADNPHTVVLHGLSFPGQTDVSQAPRTRGSAFVSLFYSTGHFFFFYLHFLNSLVNLSCWKGKYTLLFFLFLKGNSWPFLSSRYILESANLKFVCICIGSTDQLKESWHFYCMKFFVSMNIAYLCIFKSSLISLNNI